MATAAEYRDRIEKLEAEGASVLSVASTALGIARDAQPIVMVGTTPGVGAGETVELTQEGTGAFIILEDGKGYAIEVDTLITGVDSLAGDVVKRIIRNKAVARKFGGVTTLVDAGLAASTGDAAAAWTLTFVVGVGPDRIEMVFSTAAKQATCNVVSEVSLLEVPFIT